MEYWEFLLQKEGDRSWLPLESPDVEILEGRYRAVARTSRANCTVEIRIIHLSTDEVPPKRRIQKQVRRTNGDGLMVIFPFTRLQPGIWELQCVPDLMADLLGNDRQQSVRLQVLAVESEADGWQPEWQMDAALVDQDAVEVAQLEPQNSQAVPEVLITPAADLLAESSVQLELEPESTPVAPVEIAPAPQLELPALLDATVEARKVAEEVVAVAFADGLDELAEDDTPVAVAGYHWMEGASNGDLSAARSFSFNTMRLNLASQSFMAYWGQPFELLGEVVVQAPPEVETIDPLMTELQVCLRDPQTLQVLATVFQVLPLREVETSFSCLIEIPADCPTRLLLGEVSLFNAGADDEPSLTPLVTQSFTVTAALDELLVVLKQPVMDGETEDSVSIPDLDETLKPVAKLNLALLDLVKNAADKPQAPAQSAQFKPSVKSPLPPQISRSTVDRPGPKSPQLPNFSRIQPKHNFRLERLDQKQDAAATQVLDDLVTNAIDALPETLSLDEQVMQEILNSAELPPVVDAEPAQQALWAETDLEAANLEISQEGGTETEMVALDTAESGREESEPDQSDVAPNSHLLNLQERFFSRLNALASDEELSEELRTAFAAALIPEDLLVDVTDESVDEVLEPISDSILDDHREGEDERLDTLVVEDEWVAREIVIEDDFLMPQPDQVQPEQVPESAVLVMMADVEPLPVPELEIPPGELVADKAVNVRVRLPAHIARAYVKLWLNDRQTLSLLAGPWTLSSFTPDVTGQLEATTQIKVPPGSLEVQFEAIAIEYHSQRQSRKATCSRMVIPANLPVLAFSDFEDL